MNYNCFLYGYTQNYVNQNPVMELTIVEADYIWNMRGNEWYRSLWHWRKLLYEAYEIIPQIPNKARQHQPISSGHSYSLKALASNDYNKAKKGNQTWANIIPAAH